MTERVDDMRNKRFQIAVVMTLCLGLAVMGCQTKGQSAGGGALLGGLVGGIIGHQSGHAWEGAALGAAVGGLAGLVAHDYKTSRKSTAAETAEHYNYTPEEGVKLELRQISVEPKAVEPGDRATLTVEYATLGTGDGITVEETSVLKYGGDPFANLDQRNTKRADGIWVNTIVFEVPKDAELGNYMVAQVLKSGTISTTGQAGFEVVQKVAAAN